MATRSLIGTEARFTARARVSALPADRCRPPLSLFEELSRRPGTRGASLMESAAKGKKAGTRSLVVPEGVVRLQVRGEEASYRALQPGARPLLEALADFRAVEARDPGLTDEERLCSPSVLDAVRALAGLVQDEENVFGPAPGVYGAFSYELVDRWEDLPPRRPDPWHEPDIDVVLALDTILYDHLAGEVRVVTRSVSSSDERAADERHRTYLRSLQTPHREEKCILTVLDKDARPDVTDDEFLDSVRKFLRHIERGDIFQGVLSRRLAIRSPADSLAVYRELRRENPSPYMFHVDLGEGVLLGSSPETCLKVEGTTLEIRPIAGTAPRGFTADGAIDPELDSRLAIGLLLDPKEQAEHAMLVDLARNDVSRVSIPGTRRIEEPFTIEKYSHVQHLVSAVVGELRPGLDALHAYRAAANMGTLTGAPKLRAMELIRETEPSCRGFYGGAVGYLLADGTFDSCIVIRSLRSRPAGYETRAGAGIVADSIPERELQETTHKARAVLRAVALAEASS
ncbi:MAG: anthranilate synthase component I family protein [Vicinamibacteria bacterium]